MKEIIALKEYTDKYVSLYEGEIRNIGDGIADKLIEQGIVAEHSDDSGKDSKENDIMFVYFNLENPDGYFKPTSDANYSSTEIYEAYTEHKPIIFGCYVKDNTTNHSFLHYLGGCSISETQVSLSFFAIAGSQPPSSDIYNIDQNKHVTYEN